MGLPFSKYGGWVGPAGTGGWGRGGASTVIRAGAGIFRCWARKRGVRSDHMEGQRLLLSAQRRARIALTLAGAHCIPAPLRRAWTTCLLALSTIPLSCAPWRRRRSLAGVPDLSLANAPGSSPASSRTPLRLLGQPPRQRTYASARSARSAPRESSALPARGLLEMAATSPCRLRVPPTLASTTPAKGPVPHPGGKSSSRHCSHTA